MRFSTKKLTGFIAGAVALTMVAGTFAFYTSTGTLENHMQTNQYGSEMDEQFTPGDWAPGDSATKDVSVTNNSTGSYGLIVRIKMSETWTRRNGSCTGMISFDSTNSAFTSVVMGGGTPPTYTANQANPTDGLYAGDDSVVFKHLINIGTGDDQWTFNPADGYWYYNSIVPAGGSTSSLMDSITLADNVDTGKAIETRYYTKAATKPAANNIGSNVDNQWVAYTGDIPADATFTRVVSSTDQNAQGYSNADYKLTITYETLQATPQAQKGTASWSTTPAALVAKLGA